MSSNNKSQLQRCGTGCRCCALRRIAWATSCGHRKEGSIAADCASRPAGSKCVFSLRPLRLRANTELIMCRRHGRGEGGDTSVDHRNTRRYFQLEHDPGQIGLLTQFNLSSHHLQLSIKICLRYLNERIFKFKDIKFRFVVSNRVDVPSRYFRTFDPQLGLNEGLKDPIG